MEPFRPIIDKSSIIETVPLSKNQAAAVFSDTFHRDRDVCYLVQYRQRLY